MTDGVRVTYPTECLVNGVLTTAEQYREDHGLTKDQYRDIVFDLGMYKKHEAPNGDILLDPLSLPLGRS